MTTRYEKNNSKLEIWEMIFSGGVLLVIFNFDDNIMSKKESARLAGNKERNDPRGSQV